MAIKHDRKSEQFGTLVTKKDSIGFRAVEWHVQRWSNVDRTRIVAGPFYSLKEAEEEAQRRMDGRK